MKKIAADDASYKTFQDILTGYRVSNTLKVAYESGIFDVIGDNRLPGTEICKKTGWDEGKGGRFLEALCGLGFLDNRDGLYRLSLFSLKFFRENSKNYQGGAIEFEGRLMESWNLLNETLETGERIYNTADKTGEEYEKALETYLEAMNDAAKIRACEMWDHFDPGNGGLIIDAGAGSGAFLVEFLNRHNTWQGIFCDLQDVITITEKKSEMIALADRITYIEKNLLTDFTPREKNKDSENTAIKAKIIILSNLVHCQGKSDTMIILSNILKFLADDGIVIIHDFFSDGGWRGALYDIHMMLNTYNGRTYSIDEMKNMLAEFDLLDTKKIQLDSGSTVLAASKMPIPSEFIS